MKLLYTPPDTPGWVIPMTVTPWVLLMMGFMCLTTCRAVIIYSRWRNCASTKTNLSIFIPHSNHDKKASVPSILFYSCMHVYKFVAIIYSLFVFLTTTFYIQYRETMVYHRLIFHAKSMMKLKEQLVKLAVSQWKTFYLVYLIKCAHNHVHINYTDSWASRHFIIE